MTHAQSACHDIIGSGSACGSPIFGSAWIAPEKLEPLLGSSDRNLSLPRRTPRLSVREE